MLGRFVHHPAEQGEAEGPGRLFERSLGQAAPPSVDEFLVRALRPPGVPEALQDGIERDHRDQRSADGQPVVSAGSLPGVAMVQASGVLASTADRARSK
jgi:hypothetical protein